jgi:hypothetical protein
VVSWDEIAPRITALEAANRDKRLVKVYAATPWHPAMFHGRYGNAPVEPGTPLGEGAAVQWNDGIVQVV